MIKVLYCLENGAFLKVVNNAQYTIYCNFSNSLSLQEVITCKTVGPIKPLMKSLYPLYTLKHKYIMF